MKEAFEELASRKGWFWTAMIILTVAVGYIVNLYSTFTWTLIHVVATLLIAALIYGIAKPKDER